MAKTVILSPEAYKAVIKKKNELMDKDIEMTMQDIVAEAILAGIDAVIG